MAGGNVSEKKRKRTYDSTPAAGGSIQRKKRRQVVDSDDDDGGSSVFQPSSPIPSSSRRYAKPVSRPSAQVASSFIAKRRGVPEEIELEDSDEDLPDVASIFASSQSTKRPSQSTARQTRKSTDKTPLDKGKGKNKMPYRRPTGTLVNLGTFELDEDGNDVEELRRKREARKRRREESRRRKGGSDDSVIQCTSPMPRARAHQRASKQEVIELDSDGGEVRTPTAKRARRSSSTPTPSPRSPSPLKRCSPSPPRELEASLEILSPPGSPKSSDNPELEPVTYNPGELQALYDQELYRIVERARTFTTIVPRKKHKVFRRAPSVDPVVSHPTYTRNHSGASAIVTSLLWSRSDPYWVSVGSATSARDAEVVDSLSLDSQIGEGEETRDKLQPDSKEQLVAAKDDSQLNAQSQDVFEEDPSAAAPFDDLAAESVYVLATSLEKLTDDVSVPDGSLPQDAPAAGDPPTYPDPPPGPTPGTVPTSDISAGSFSIDSSPTAASRPPFRLPPPGVSELLSQSENDEAIIKTAMSITLRKYKPAGQDESLLRVVLLDVYEALKTEHRRAPEPSRPALSSRQSSATLASQSSDETELSSPGPVTPVHPVTANAVAGLSSVEGSGTASKHGDNVDPLMDDDDTVSIAGSSFELGYPDE